MIRRQRTEDRGQRFCRDFATQSCGARRVAAHNHLSSVFCPLSSGFTLVEMIMVIVITGIIGGMVAVFLKAPIQQYMDVGRRADMTDIADTALRRIARDLRLALPNSVRVTGSCNGSATCFIEFLPTLSGGRYRAALAASGAGDILDFTVPDNSFDVLGPVPPSPSGIQYVVVYNLGILGSDAYAGSNRTVYSGLNTATNIAISAKRFPFASPAARFQVITTPVSYVCDPVAGTLTRYWGYPIQPSQPSSAPAGATSAWLAKNVSSCSFSYNPNVVAQRSGLVTMNLSITESGETVKLYSATHVSNVP